MSTILETIRNVIAQYITEDGVPELKPGEFAVPLKDKKRVKDFNPKTNRIKNFKRNRYMITKIPPQERTLKNLPRYSDKKPKVRFQDWLQLKNGSRSNHSVGQAADSAWYGWSHRAIHGFRVGDVIKPGNIGNKYEYGDKAQKEYQRLERKYGYAEADKILKKKYGNFKPYKIKTEEEAFQHAERFAKDVA